MNASRVVSALLLLLAASTAVGWALREGRRQRDEIASALTTEAVLLARTLGPSLAAASAAQREIDEAQTSSLLSSAELLSRLVAAGGLDQDAARDIAELHELDAVVIVDRRGRTVLAAGDPPGPRTLAGIGDVVTGEIEAAVLTSEQETGIEHLAVAAALAGGGAVVVRAHARTGGRLGRGIGAAGLLRDVTNEEGVLYLSYTELPSGRSFQATWDGGPLPAPEAVASRVATVRGRPVFETRVPVVAPAGSSASLRVGLDAAPLERATSAALKRTTLVGVVLTALSLVILALATLVRLRTIEGRQARQRLAEAEAARHRSERLAAAGTLTAGLAHEVRSPLNAIALAAQRIGRRKEQSPECAEFAHGIQNEVRRLEGVLRDFLQLAGPAGGERVETELSKIVGEVFDLLEAEAGERRLQVGPISGSARASVDVDAVRRCLINLVQNAIEASPEGGAVRAELREDRRGAVVRILDQGPGIDPEQAERLFDPFFTTRAEGTGLGLSLARRVMEEHGGECTLLACDGGGTIAELLFPPRPTRGGEQ